jgi:hypothetical protein
MGWVVNIRSRSLDPWQSPSTHCIEGRVGPMAGLESPGTHCIEGRVGPMAGLEGCGKFRPPLGFDPRTVHPVASRYTDYVIPAIIQKVFHVNTYTDSLTVHTYILHIKHYAMVHR